MAILAVAMLLGLSCAGSPPPRDTFHRLVVPAAGASGAPLQGGVVVQRFQSSDALRGRALAVADSGGRTLRSSSYDFWVDPPSVLVQRALVENLRAGPRADRVVTPDQRASVRWEVSGRIERFERVAGGPSAATLEMVLRERGEREPRVQAVYEVTQPAASNDAAGAAEALGRAVGEIFERFWADVEASLTAAP